MQLSMQKLLQGNLFNSIMQRLKHDMWCAFLHAHRWLLPQPSGQLEGKFSRVHSTFSRQVTS